MANVLIAPSFGGRQSQQHWADTLDQEVDFVRQAQSEALSAAQREALSTMHPTGKARFWGATGTHDSKFDRVHPFDVVLLTGQGHIRAIGEVGVSFRNADFANTMWEPDPERGSWRMSTG